MEYNILRPLHYLVSFNYLVVCYLFYTIPGDITEHHKPGNLWRIEIFFSQSRRWGTPRLKHQLCFCLEIFLPCLVTVSSHNGTFGKAERIPPKALQEGVNLIHEGKAFMTCFPKATPFYTIALGPTFQVIFQFSPLFKPYQHHRT